METRNPNVKPTMLVSSLVELLRALNDAAISVWLDGGWGVDALLGEQTRLHKDVDIIIRVVDVPLLEEILRRRGFALQEGSQPTSMVFADDKGLEVDVHAVVFDDAGNGIYRMQNGEDWIYPAEGFVGRGMVEGMSVQCLTPTTQVLCHAEGYKPSEIDRHDMQLLAQRFGIELPPQLKGTKK